MSAISISQESSRPLNERASLGFLQWRDLYNTEHPFVSVTPLAPGKPDTNVVIQMHHDILIEDIRGRESNFTLDEYGFRVVKAPTLGSFSNFDSKSAIEKFFLPAIEELAKTEIEGADRVFTFDWRLRRADFTPQVVDTKDQHQYLPPSYSVHIDQTPSELLKRLRRHLGSELDTLPKGRFRVINLWKPLENAVQDRPLALCDGRTVNPKDLVAGRIIRPGENRETYYVMRNGAQRWYFLSQQMPDELLVFKIYDSNTDVPAKYCPHTSFEHREPFTSTHPRQSIEVRMFVFSDAVEGEGSGDVI